MRHVLVTLLVLLIAANLSFAPQAGRPQCLGFLICATAQPDPSNFDDHRDFIVPATWPEGDAAAIASIQMARRPSGEAMGVVSGTACLTLFNVSLNATLADMRDTPTNLTVRVAANRGIELRGCQALAMWGTTLRIHLGLGAWVVVSGCQLELSSATVEGLDGSPLRNATVVVQERSRIIARGFAFGTDRVRAMAVGLAGGRAMGSAGMAVVGRSTLSATCAALSRSAVCDAGAAAPFLYGPAGTMLGPIRLAAANGSRVDAFAENNDTTFEHDDTRVSALALLIDAKSPLVTLSSLSITATSATVIRVKGHRAVAAAGGIALLRDAAANLTGDITTILVSASVNTRAEFAGGDGAAATAGIGVLAAKAFSTLPVRLTVFALHANISVETLSSAFNGAAVLGLGASHGGRIELLSNVSAIAKNTTIALHAQRSGYAAFGIVGVGAREGRAIVTLGGSLVVGSLRSNISITNMGASASAGIGVAGVGVNGGASGATVYVKDSSVSAAIIGSQVNAVSGNHHGIGIGGIAASGGSVRVDRNLSVALLESTASVTDRHHQNTGIGIGGVGDDGSVAVSGTVIAAVIRAAVSVRARSLNRNVGVAGVGGWLSHGIGLSFGMAESSVGFVMEQASGRHEGVGIVGVGTGRQSIENGAPLIAVAVNSNITIAPTVQTVGVGVLGFGTGSSKNVTWQTSVMVAAAACNVSANGTDVLSLPALITDVTNTTELITVSSCSSTFSPAGSVGEFRLLEGPICDNCKLQKQSSGAGQLPACAASSSIVQGLMSEALVPFRAVLDGQAILPHVSATPSRTPPASASGTKTVLWHTLTLASSVNQSHSISLLPQQPIQSRTRHVLHSATPTTTGTLKVTMISETLSRSRMVTATKSQRSLFDRPLLQTSSSRPMHALDLVIPRTVVATATVGTLAISALGSIAGSASRLPALAAVSRAAMCIDRSDRDLLTDGPESDWLALPLQVALPLVPPPPQPDGHSVPTPEAVENLNTASGAVLWSILLAAVPWAGLVMSYRRTRVSSAVTHICSVAAAVFTGYLGPNVAELSTSIAMNPRAPDIGEEATTAVAYHGAAVLAAVSAVVLVAAIAKLASRFAPPPSRPWSGDFDVQHLRTTGNNRDESAERRVAFVACFGPFFDGCRDFDSTLTRLCVAADFAAATLLSVASALPAAWCSAVGPLCLATATCHAVYVATTRPLLSQMELGGLAINTSLQLVGALLVTVITNGEGGAMVQRLVGYVCALQLLLALALPIMILVWTCHKRFKKTDTVAVVNQPLLANVPSVQNSHTLEAQTPQTGVALENPLTSRSLAHQAVEKGSPGAAVCSRSL